MTVSTASFNLSSPSSACLIFFCPSNAKGLVTTATTRAPLSLGGFCYYRGSSGACTSAHTGGDKDHIGAIGQLQQPAPGSQEPPPCLYPGLLPAPSPCVSSTPSCSFSSSPRVSSGTGNRYWQATKLHPVKPGFDHGVLRHCLRNHQRRSP